MRHESVASAVFTVATAVGGIALRTNQGRVLLRKRNRLQYVEHVEELGITDVEVLPLAV